MGSVPAVWVGCLRSINDCRSSWHGHPAVLWTRNLHDLNSENENWKARRIIAEITLRYPELLRFYEGDTELPRLCKGWA
eukprot:1803182-Amphidinium_carterae.2